MGKAPPVPTRCFIKYLISIGCTEDHGSRHAKWKCKGCLRSIIFDRNRKEIPYLHVHTNLKNLGKTMADFKKWANGNC